LAPAAEITRLVIKAMRINIKAWSALRREATMPALKLPSRRLLLKQSLAAGGLCLATSYAGLGRAQELAPTPQCRDHDDPTEAQIEGPFFKPLSPERADLVEAGTPGRIFELEGQVLTPLCRPVAVALLDLWHADENGDYDDFGYRYRGHIHTDAAGRYRFRTILPGLYPGRTRHYHFKVQAPQSPLLTTQLYFPGEPRNANDCFYSPALLMRVSNGASESNARFDFVLDIA
jgi:protocatechuate 3,4-dioxygenase beta subunit